MTKTQTIGAVLILIQTLGCAIMKPDGSTYYESSYNDHNQAPSQYVPPANAGDDKQTVDAVNMRAKADFHFTRGEALSFEGKSAAAIQDFKAALVFDSNSPSLFLRVATEHLKAGQIKEAVIYAQEALKKDPNYVEARVLLGSVYSAMRMYDRALEQYETVLKIDPKNTEAPLYMGAVYSELKDYKKAVKSFESLLKHPDYATPHLAYYYVGRVYSESKEPQAKEKAIKAFRKAIELKPDFTDAVISLGNLLTKSEKPKAAIDLYIQHQKKNGGQLKLAEILSQYFIEKGDYDSAYEQLEIIENQSDEPLNAKLKMGLILVEKKAYDRAIEKLKEILREVPESDKVNFYLGAIYEEIKDYSNSVKHYKQVVSTSPFYGDSVLHAAMLSKQINNSEEAVALLKVATEKRVANPSVYIYYASLQDEANQSKDAFATMQLAVQLFPDHPQSHFYLGTLFDKSGDREATLLQMEKAIELDDEHVQALNYLAFTLAEMNKDLERAELLARRAVKLSPTDGYVIDTLGWIFFKQGKMGPAVTTLEKAYKLQPQVSIIAEHLAEAYEKHQLPGKAREMFLKAAELETDVIKSQALKSRVTASEPRLPTSDRQPAALQPDRP